MELVGHRAQEAALARHPRVVVRVFPRAHVGERLAAVEVVRAAGLTSIVGFGSPQAGRVTSSTRRSFTSIRTPPSASTTSAKPRRLTIAW